MKKLASLDGWTKQSIDALVARAEVDDLRLVPIAITCWGTPDPQWSENICLSLSQHSDPFVRGNAVLGLGHLSRVCGVLDKARCLPVVEAALSDPDAHVRGQANAAVDDLNHFLGWSVKIPE